MFEQLKGHLLALFKFYRRSRLLLGIGLVYLGWIAFSLVVSTTTRSGTGRFELTRTLFDQLNGFANVLTAVLGVLVLSSHLRNKSLKVIFTKPAPPAVWLAACVLSAATVSLMAHAFTLALVLGLSVAWGVPLQLGFVVLSAHAFFSALALLGFVMFLTMAVHPVLAAFLLLLLRESTFYWLLERVCYAIYLLIPSLDPYGEDLASVSRSLRASGHDVEVLLWSAGYALTCLAFFYSVSAALLRRKDLS